MEKKLSLSILFLGSFFFLSGQASSKERAQPDYLKKGDTIVILAPAGVLKEGEEVVLKAKKLAESWGLKVRFGDSLFKKNHHFAGTDKQRSTDFQKALDNSNVKAIWAARGGYGSVRVLELLDFEKFKKQPKWIIGYSDITAFHNHISNLGIETIHGMMPMNLGEDFTKIKTSVSSLKAALFGKPLKYTIQSSIYNRTSNFSNLTETIEGQLVGGNLSILVSMLGSKSQISTKNKILFIEEVGEYKYSIDRMLQSLKRAGYFKQVKAVIVGDISKVKENTPLWGSSIEELILNVVPKNIPILFNFPAGHEPENRALIFGRDIELIIGSQESTVLFKE